MTKLTIAYIGNGKSTNRYHLPFALKQADKITVKTIYARHDDHTWARIPGVHYTTDINDIYNDDSIQLVVVATPAETHYTLAKEALTRGKNVLVEKPFTETVAEARELFDLAKAKGLMIQCYQNRRFDSDFLTVQQVIESGKLGDLLEVEDTFDYFRPETPENSTFSAAGSFLYGHACHTLDQIISYFGKPDSVHSDVRQLLGRGKMNDYFDLDLYYGKIKVAVKSSFFRLVPRPSFSVYGKRGVFIKQGMDRQETHLKMFYMPTHPDFGLDRPEDYGTLTYVDDNGQYHQEKVVSAIGDYSRVYAGLYETLINGKPKAVKDEETLLQLQILQDGIQPLVDQEEGK
ncbi:oxidoreductase [Lacticaseibacillus yichunensis]|uniref:Oxidoreductase n=1 Tax=Lacticaseibacillus yichunensis TaxID=2486015 RepID=A0ABW4CQ76_9LACO|nr:oxidoreductase [Lacticaseibacillus yichunensis]